MTTAAVQRNQVTPPQAQPALRVCGATDTGLRREHNEDTFVIADLGSGEVSSPCVETGLSLLGSGYLLMVCDGMGGAAAGEVAAHIAAGSIRQRLVDAGKAVSAHPEEALDDAFAVANRAILADAKERPQRRGMGTTCTAAVVFPGTVTIAQVGDSRAYLLHDGQLSPLTKDQSLATQLLDQGVLTPDQVSSFPHRNILLQALGCRTAIAPVFSQHQLSPGDRVLLCSDGLHGSISDADIEAAMKDAGDLTNVTKMLVDRALAAGGEDNVTVVVAQYRADMDGADADSTGRQPVSRRSSGNSSPIISASSERPPV